MQLFSCSIILKGGMAIGKKNMMKDPASTKIPLSKCVIFSLSFFLSFFRLFRSSNMIAFPCCSLLV